eukprot:gene3072-3618_t
MIYRNDNKGWGNRMQATVSAFLFALLSKRVLFIEHTMFFKYFQSPPWWSWHAPEELRNRYLGPRARAPCSKFHRSAARMSAVNLSVGWPDECYVVSRNYQYHWDLGVNPMHRHVQLGLFGSFSSHARQALLTTSLLAWPYPHFVNNVSAYLNSVSFFDAPHRACVQVRVDKDDSPEKVRPALSTIFGCVNDHLRSLGYPPDQTVVFYISDAVSLMLKAQRRYSTFGRVVTGYRPNFFQAHFRKEPYKAGAVTPTMRDWYALGECTAVITTYTSFGAYAAFRGGSRHKTLVAGRDVRRVCPALPNPLYPPWYDDHPSNKTVEQLAALLLHDAPDQGLS